MNGARAVVACSALGGASGRPGAGQEAPHAFRFSFIEQAVSENPQADGPAGRSARPTGCRHAREKLKKVFADHMINDSDIPEDMRRSKMVGPRVCYFAGGIVNLYKQWFRGDLDCTLNDIALEVSKLLQLEAKELL